MERKQFWAKVGVFVLVVGNLGAYYAFWPTSSGTTGEPAKPAEEKKDPAPPPLAPKFSAA